MRFRQLIFVVCSPALVPVHPALALSEGAGKMLRFPIASDIASIQIEIGTPITLRMKQKIKGGTAAKGTQVEMEVASDVLAPDGRRVILKAGTPAYGTVSESRGAGAFGRPGRIAITCDYVAAPEGIRIPLRPAGSKAAAGATGKSRVGASVLTGIAVAVPTTAVLVISSGLSGIGAGWGGPDSSTTSSSDGTGALFIGIGAGVLVSSLWRGGAAVIPEGRLVQTEAASTVVMTTTYNDPAKKRDPQSERIVY